jgi:hypothetical protein
LDLNADYISFAESRIHRTDLAFAGAPVATPVTLRGTVSGRAVVVGAGLNWAF